MHFARNWMKATPRQQRHLEYIASNLLSMFSTYLVKDNIIADSLSRIDELHLQPTFDYEEINLDIIGPIPSSEGFRFCLTIIDRYSRWMGTFPMPDIRAETVADNILKDRSKPCFSYNSSESDIESSIGEDTPNKPVEMPEKKIRFALLPLPTLTR
ncbi:hypothetical protein TNCV_2010081, partial [Trichonephila clavipes]